MSKGSGSMLDKLSVEQGIEALKRGELVLFPTETSFGLGCVALNGKAVNRLVAAKNRPPGKPLPVLLPSLEYLLGFGLESPLFLIHPNNLRILGDRRN